MDALCVCTVLDPEGRIRWFGEGFAEPDDIDRMIRLTKEIAAGKWKDENREY